MNEGQATAIIVLLAIPVGVLVLAFIGGCVVAPILEWRGQRKYKKGEPLRKLQDEVSNLRSTQKYLREDFNKHLAETVKPTPAGRQ